MAGPLSGGEGLWLQPVTLHDGSSKCPWEMFPTVSVWWQWGGGVPLGSASPCLDSLFVEWLMFINIKNREVI